MDLAEPINGQCVVAAGLWSVIPVSGMTTMDAAQYIYPVVSVEYDLITSSQVKFVKVADNDK